MHFLLVCKQIFSFDMRDKRWSSSVSFLTVNVITTLSITLVLFLLGTTFLIGFTGRGFSAYLKENMSISVELGDSISEASVAKIKKQLDANRYVKSAVYISREEVKQRLVADLGRDPEEVLGYNPSKSYFDVFIKSEYVNGDSLKRVEASLKGGGTLIQNVVYSADDISTSNTNLSKVGAVFLLFAIFLIIISFTLIHITIQLNIYAKRFLIHTMQLVGATNAFIRRPFTLRTMVSGIVAAILANIAIAGAVYYFTNEYPELTSILKMEELVSVFVLVLLSGILITVSTTTLAVNKYLKMTTNNIYNS